MSPRFISFLKHAGILFLVAYASTCLYDAQVAPLIGESRSLRDQIQKEQEQIRDARESIAQIKQRSLEAAAAQQDPDWLHIEIPSGAAIVWVPQRLKTHFGSFGIPVGVTRLIRMTADPELPGFHRAYWALALPGLTGERAAQGLLLAVAGLERQFGLFKVTDVRFQSDLDTPGAFVASISLASVVRE